MGPFVGSWAGGGEALMEGPGCFHATSVFRAVTQAPPVKASPASRPLLLPLFKVNFSQVHTLLPTRPRPPRFGTHSFAEHEERKPQKNSVCPASRPEPPSRRAGPWPVPQSQEAGALSEAGPRAGVMPYPS